MTRTKHVERSSHGYLKNGAHPPEYAIWKMMIQRCRNPNYAEYKNYGARGVEVCDRWRAKGGFENFLADMGPQPFAHAGLRLLNPDGNFEPGNVEWRDTRIKHLLTHDGRTLPLAAWASERGMKEATLRARLQDGWTTEDMLTRGLANRGFIFTWTPEEEQENEPADECGVSNGARPE
jgi:hypothetical protein